MDNHSHGRSPEIDLVPGTELMTDIGNTHFVHAHNSSQATVLVPQPTNNPDDPLVSGSSVYTALRIR